MRKRIATLAAGLGAAAALLPVGPAAHAQGPFACFGVQGTPEAFLCLIRGKAGATPYPDGGWIKAPGVCVFICTEPIEQETPRVEPYEGEMLVYWYNNNCYYHYTDGSYTTTPTTVIDC